MEPPRPDALDAKDRQLLQLLQEDGRRAYKELGAAVGLAPSTVHARVRRLSETGVLRGVHGHVDGSALGVGLRAMVFVQLHSQAAPTTNGFRRAVVEFPEVRSLFEVAGRFDYLLHVIARDPAHLRQFRNERLATLEGVRNIETALIFDHWRAPVLPDWGAP
mgnify:CR=1 FL=1